MDEQLNDILIKLNINYDSLSKNEKKYITQIFNAYQDFDKENKRIKEAQKNNKFNKSAVAKKVDCSRQTLYKNPTLVKLLDYCVELSKSQTDSLIPQNFIEKDKYDRLKKENNQLLDNIIDIAVKDAVIDQLNKEISEKDQRINDLIKALEKERSKNAKIRLKSIN